MRSNGIACAVLCLTWRPPHRQCPCSDSWPENKELHLRPHELVLKCCKAMGAGAVFQRHFGHGGSLLTLPCSLLAPAQLGRRGCRGRRC